MFLPRLNKAQITLTTAIITANISLSVAACSMHRAQARPSSFSSRVLIGIATYKLNGFLIWFAGHLSADDFFEGISPVETPTGRKFRKAASYVEVFPKELLIDLVVDVSTSAGFPIIGTPPMVEQLLRSLTFQAYWESSLGLRPAKILAVNLREATMDDLHLNSNTRERVKDLPDLIEGKFIYELTIQSSEVPLTDHLLLDVLGPGGEKMVRLSARLDDRN